MMMSRNTLRSIASCIALRMSGSSKGGLSRFTIRFIDTIVSSTSQIALGAWLWMSRIVCTVASYGNVMSNWPAIKARVCVDRLGMIVHSIASR